MRAQTAYLVEAAGSLGQIEAATDKFLRKIVPSGAVGTNSTADRLFQSLEFLLITASVALRAKDRDEIGHLRQLTYSISLRLKAPSVRSSAPSKRGCVARVLKSPCRLRARALSRLASSWKRRPA